MSKSAENPITLKPGEPPKTMERDRMTWRIFDGLIGLVLAGTLAVQAWTLTTVIDHGKSLAEISGNRFTAGDGLAVWQEIGRIRTDFAELPTDNAPSWFVQRVDELAETMSASDERIHAIDLKLARLSATLAEQTKRNHEP